MAAGAVPEESMQKIPVNGKDRNGRRPFVVKIVKGAELSIQPDFKDLMQQGKKRKDLITRKAQSFSGNQKQGDTA